MIPVTPRLAIEEDALEWRFLPAGGPGGQHANRSATAVQLRVDLARTGLPPDVRARLARLAGRRMAVGGTLVIEARRFRSQEQNRQDALNRLLQLVRRAAQKPKPRRKTRPSRAARERRLRAKHHRSEVKRRRRPPAHTD
ncbi:MAG: aminoacyl-tRNA hydrolase [Caldilineae bacterium]|nr:MAG: aminoacyl-tRNA hydrolase [Caldilineae bacterium]